MLGFMPPDDVLLAIGRLVICFDQLEYWVNTGIIEGSHVTGAAEQAKTSGWGFEARVGRLESAFTKAESNGWITPDRVLGGPWRLLLHKLQEVSQRRNDLIHGVTMSLVKTAGESIHAKFNPKSGRRLELKAADIDDLCQTARRYAEPLEVTVLNLCLAKQAKVIERPSGWMS